jgi:3-methyladenine DNA glycosylase Mpg
MAMGISLAENQLDLLGHRVFLEDRCLPGGGLAWGPRVGITVGTERQWRVYALGSPAVSDSKSKAKVKRQK